MKNCTRCGELLPLDSFYFVSKKLGTRRGQCKECMAEVKREQRDPTWRPSCARCGAQRDRSGPGRRLCWSCFEERYDSEDRRQGGSHREKLKPCTSCGAKRLRADHVPGTSLCPICRSVPSGRRTRLNTFYNLTPREYTSLLEHQKGRCAICKKKPRKSLHIDHQHKQPSIVRGAVCNTCNMMLAQARDRPHILRAAADYLDAPPAQALFPGKTASERANRRPFSRVTRRK